jgi:hypothetical protein
MGWTQASEGQGGRPPLGLQGRRRRRLQAQLHPQGQRATRSQRWQGPSVLACRAAMPTWGTQAGAGPSMVTPR